MSTRDYKRIVGIPWKLLSVIIYYDIYDKTTIIPTGKNDNIKKKKKVNDVEYIFPLGNRVDPTHDAACQ